MSHFTSAMVGTPHDGLRTHRWVIILTLINIVMHFTSAMVGTPHDGLCARTPRDGLYMHRWAIISTFVKVVMHFTSASIGTPRDGLRWYVHAQMGQCPSRLVAECMLHLRMAKVISLARWPAGA
eukprot:861478-Pelagomonas_calceolata.AAC.3